MLAVWALSIQAGECKIGDEVHGKRLQNLTGLAVDDARRWAQILFNAQIAYANGEITQEATDYVRAKMQLETDPDSRRGATQ